MDLSGGKGERTSSSPAMGRLRASRTGTRAPRDRLHEHKHRPLDRAALAGSSSRRRNSMISSSSWTPVGMCRPGARARSSRSARGRCRAPRDRRATRAAVHPLRHLAEAEPSRCARRRARNTARSQRARRARRRRGESVVVGAELLRGALGAARRLRQDADPGEARKVAETPGGALLQIPQDTGSRGVAGRPRDVAVTSFADDAFPKERLEVLLDPDTAYATADVRVIDGLGDVVAGQVGGTGSSVVFYLPQDRAACRARVGRGRVTAPVELYAPLAEPPTIALRPIEEPEPTPPRTSLHRPGPPPRSRPCRRRRRPRRAEPRRPSP